MEHYYTYLHDFKFNSNIVNEELFLLSGGEEGLTNNHLNQNSDRVTRLIPFSEEKTLERVNLTQLKYLVNRLIRQAMNYNITYETQNSHYTTWHIPKATGGVRTIEGPSDVMKSLQHDLVFILRNELHMLEHNNAHAYVPKKSTRTNAEYHRRSNHFAKVDFSNFFPSIKTKHLLEILPKVGNLALAKSDNKELAETLKDLLTMVGVICTLDDRLPQGAVTSPLLSNLIMVPFDYHMVEFLRKNHPNIIYTRYADDIEFSSYYAFADRKEAAKTLVEGFIEHIVKEHYTFDGEPMLKLNPKKTRVSTNHGKNRITGIKVNKDHQLSVGYKEKRELKQNLANLLIEKRNTGKVDETMKNEVLGWLSYLKGIEPGYAKYVETTLLKKFKIDASSIRQYLKR